MKVPISKPPSEFKKFRFFATLGSAFLGLGGLFWSLDGTFVYLSFIVSIACFFLALIYRPAMAEAENFKTTTGYSKPKTESDNQTAKVKSALTWFGVSMGILIFFGLVGSLIGDSVESYDELFAAAESYKYSGELDSAKVYYRRALNLSESPEAYLAYGDVHFTQSNYDSAIYFYDEVLRLQSNHVYALYNKAAIRFNQRRYEESMVFTRAALSVDPAYAAAYQMMGDNFYERKSYDSALFFYEKAYENGARSGWVSHVMGYLYDEKGKTEEAIRMYQEAFSYDSSKVDVARRLGELMRGTEGQQYRDFVNRNPSIN